MEAKRKRTEESKSKNRKRIYAVVASLAIVFAVYLIISAPIAPMQCFANGTKFTYGYDAKLFIRIGPDSDNQFIRFPAAEDDPTTTKVKENAPIGVLSGCRWPITTGDPNAPGERGTNWTAIHIRSPVVHLYTLGDFFKIWSYTSAGTAVNFGPDGVSTVSGPTYVSYNFGPEQRADPDMQIPPDDWIVIRVYTLDQA